MSEKIKVFKRTLKEMLCIDDEGKKEFEAVSRLVSLILFSQFIEIRKSAYEFLKEVYDCDIEIAHSSNGNGITEAYIRFEGEKKFFLVRMYSSKNFNKNPSKKIPFWYH